MRRLLIIILLFASVAWAGAVLLTPRPRGDAPGAGGALVGGASGTGGQMNRPARLDPTQSLLAPRQYTGPPRTFYSDIPFVKLAPGRFVMGSPPHELGRNPQLEKQRPVEIESGFALGVYEVTQAQYWAVIEPGKAVTNGAVPMTDVTWDQATAFCEKLSELHPGKRFRLPSEAEWEYACRAGQGQMYSVWEGNLRLFEAIDSYQRGDERRLIRRAEQQFNFDSLAAEPVGQYPANDWGLHDMHGNVWEWCDAPPLGQPSDLPSLQHRPIRGGAWTSVNCLDCRSANRSFQNKDMATAAIGFRVLLENP